MKTTGWHAPLMTIICLVNRTLMILNANFTSVTSAKIRDIHKAIEIILFSCLLVCLSSYLLNIVIEYALSLLNQSPCFVLPSILS